MKTIMKKTSAKLIPFLLMIIMMVTACGDKTAGGDYHGEVESIYQYFKTFCGLEKEDSLLSAGVLNAGDSASQWLAFIIAKEELEENTDPFLAKMEEWVSKQYEISGGLDDIMATEYQRTALTVLALGGDPTNFGSYQGKPINLVADGSYNWKKTDNLASQGSNALIFALTMLQAGDFEIPVDAVYTADDIIEKLIAYQDPETGGIGLAAKGEGNVDLTAMAVAAMAGYQGRNDVDAFLEKAVNYLSEAQAADGSYSNGEEASSESCAQVIIACCALGIDPATDERFVKDSSVVNALAAFKTDDGGYSHTMNAAEADGMATYQAGLAYTALDLMEKGRTLYK